MKLKKWLILSYVVVMLIPIVTGYGLFKWIEGYNNRTELKDYINVISEFDRYDTILQKPRLYKLPAVKWKLVKDKDKDKVEIKLYTKKGRQIYSSLEQDFSYAVSFEQLYSGLNELKHGYRADSIKKPVFEKDELVGFYELTIMRDKWITGVSNGTKAAYAIYGLVLLLVFIAVVILLDRKLTRPVQLLIRNMNEYADMGQCRTIEYLHKDEIGELIRHFNQMRQEIDRQKDEVMRQQKSKEYMIASISHDLKTPLTSIRAYAESLGETRLTEKEAMEYVSIVLGKCDYMKSMLDDLLTYTILTTDYQFDFVEVEGAEFFDMLFSGYDELCERKGITLQVQNTVSASYRVDVKNMTRVVDNLINNAIRFATGERRINISACSCEAQLPKWLETSQWEELENWRGDGTLLLVRNTGNEIPEEIRQQIFLPFYQGDDARNKKHKNGAGLGLSIVNIIIEKHMGSIKLLSAEGLGTTIACWIPEIKEKK